MASKRRDRRAKAARRRGQQHGAEGDRRVGQAIRARRDLASRRAGGRAWLNGHEVGGADPRYTELEASHD